MKNKVYGTIIGATLLVTGGGAAIDNAIDPYTETTAAYTLDVNNDAVIIAKDKPSYKLEKWNGESAITVKRAGAFHAQDRSLFSKVLKTDSTDGTESVIVQPVKDGTKIDVILNTIPASNSFDFTIDGWQEFDFFYQDLNNQGLKGETCSAGQNSPTVLRDGVPNYYCVNEKGEQTAWQPIDVYGSYAVYHKTKVNNQYKNGKAFHIYRPKIIDSDGKETWGTLSFHNGVLTVTAPMDFLLSATYPVRIDPTFGDSVPGGSTAFTQRPFAFPYAAPENGTITSMTSYMSTSTGTASLSMAVYSNTGTLPKNVLVRDSGNATIVSGAAAEYTISMSLAITGGTTYWLTHWQNKAALYYYDGVAGGHTGGTTSFDTYQDPWVDSSSTSRRPTTYATYTAAASVPLTPIPGAVFDE